MSKNMKGDIGSYAAIIYRLSTFLQKLLILAKELHRQL